jgi:hypothetical protein
MGLPFLLDYDGTKRKQRLKTSLASAKRDPQLLGEGSACIACSIYCGASLRHFFCII